jgi:galactokinase
MEQVRGVRDQLLQRRAFHVVSELARVRVTSDLLRAGHPADMGAFLTASHESLRDHFEVSCPELDVAVESALLAGALGARLTGGGFGGSAIVLSRERDVPRVVERVEAAYRQQDWKTPAWWVATPSAGTHRLP